MVCAPVRRDNPRALARGLSLRTGAQTMLYLTCTTITSVDLAHYGVSRAKDWVSVHCGTIFNERHFQLPSVAKYFPSSLFILAERIKIYNAFVNNLSQASVVFESFEICIA